MKACPGYERYGGRLLNAVEGSTVTSQVLAWKRASACAQLLPCLWNVRRTRRHIDIEGQCALIWAMVQHVNAVMDHLVIMHTSTMQLAATTAPGGGFQPPRRR